jgi:Flp pilus assembly pilin Flp
MISAALRRLGGDVRGAAITELGLILVPFIVVLVGSFDLGYQSYIRSTLQGALNDVARTASVEKPEFGAQPGSIEDKIRARVRQKMGGLGKSGTYDIKISNHYRFSGIGKPERLITDVNGNGRYDPGDCWLDTNPNGRFDLDAGATGLGGADDIVFYEAVFRSPRIVPIARFVGIPKDYEIRAQTAIRSQPYANQRQPEVRC